MKKIIELHIPKVNVDTLKEIGDILKLNFVVEDLSAQTYLLKAVVDVDDKLDITFLTHLISSVKEVLKNQLVEQVVIIYKKSTGYLIYSIRLFNTPEKIVRGEVLYQKLDLKKDAEYILNHIVKIPHFDYV